MSCWSDPLDEPPPAEDETSPTAGAGARATRAVAGAEARGHSAERVRARQGGAPSCRVYVGRAPAEKGGVARDSLERERGRARSPGGAPEDAELYDVIGMRAPVHTYM